jgi:hypothetical protein
MSKVTTVPAFDEEWGDTGALGNDIAHARPAPTAGRDLDDAAGLQLISIRLPKTLIDDLKFIAEQENLKYQPLIRRVLCRFTEAEMKIIARKLAAEKEANLLAPEPLLKTG